MYDPFANFSKHILPNGLTVFHSFWDRPWLKMRAVVHSGAGDDPSRLPGLAHYVEHLASENVPGRTAMEIREFFDRIGGGVSLGTTSYQMTHYGFAIPAEDETIREAMEIFGSMLFLGQLNRQIEHERQVIGHEFNECYPYPERLEWSMRQRRAVFAGHRLENYNRPVGYPHGFREARQIDLQSFYDQHYVPANISLVVVGGIETSKLLSKLQESPFAVHKPGTRNPLLSPLGNLPTPTESMAGIKMSEQSDFHLSRAEYKATWSFSAAFPIQALHLFVQLLRRSLFNEIREKKGHSYKINVGHNTFRDVREFYIDTNIEPGNSSSIDELVDRNITEVAADREKFETGLKSRIIITSMSDHSGEAVVSGSTSDLGVYHRIISMGEENETLRRVTFDQMAEAAAMLSPQRRHSLIIEP